MKLRGKEGLSRMHKTMFNSASYMEDLSLPEFTQILELVFEDENCSFMNKNFCNQGSSVFFSLPWAQMRGKWPLLLQRLLTLDCKSRTTSCDLFPRAQNIVIRIMPASALPMGVLLGSPIILQFQAYNFYGKRGFFFPAFKDTALPVHTVATHCL